MLKENLDKVLENIAKACERSGRKPSDVKLLAVSKTKPESDIMELYDASYRFFGENYVQELVGKIEDLPKDIEWHMIGHLQRNKVKYIVGKVAMIHSVESKALAEQISRLSEANGLVTDVLVEVNVAEEESKFGVSCDMLEDFLREIAQLKGIRVKGLMTSAPFTENAEENRKYFRKLNKLMVDINLKNIDNISMSELSMGMTNDYEVAVEEGATIVRVGTAIFGARNYKN